MTTWTITIHPRPDTDALFAACAVIVCLNLKIDDVTLRFDADPDTSWHDPSKKRLTMDVGKGPLDHHRLPNPRSTCAFIETCEFLRTHPDYATTPQAVRKAQALQDRLGAIVHLQDSTGRITVDRDETVQSMSIPELINQTVWNSQNDHGAWTILAPLIINLFKKEIVAWYVQNKPHDLWQHPDIDTILTSHDRTTHAISMQRTAGVDSPLDSLREIVWTTRPDCNVLITKTTWVDTNGALVSHSIWLSVRRECPLNAKAIVETMLADPTIDEDLFDELTAWWKEDTFAGRGSLKFVSHQPPPAHVLTRLLDHVTTYISER